MQEKTKYKIEFVLTILLIIGVLIFKFIPEFKNTLGSSDSFLDTKAYDGIIEIKINDKPDFALVTEKDYIEAVLFFDKESLCLYNQNIEDKTIEEGINSIVEILIKNNYLKSSYTITFVKYSDVSFEKVQATFKNKLQSMKVNANYTELPLTLEQRAKSLGIEVDDSNKIIRELELYSKEIVRHDKNTISEYERPVLPDSLTEETAKELTDNVYKKIEGYVEKNNIINQQATETTLPITLIPATADGNTFPNSTSWYYVKDSKIYAYISITSSNKIYDYCYQGSIDTNKKGQC